MRGLAKGDGDLKEFPQLLKNNFVFLNVYCRSVKEEHEPRGPEGPFQFNDRSVPVLVIKKYTGESIVHQLGFYSNAQQATNRLAGIVRGAIKDHGPVMPPRAMIPLRKNLKAGLKHLKKDRPGKAYKEFAKAVKGGNDKKKFPDGAPSPSVEAKQHIEKIVAQGKSELEAAAAAEDPLKAVKSVRRRYKGIEELAELIKKALAAAES